MSELLNAKLIELLGELQALKSLDSFALAGGTNLSYRYNHRDSIDLDLFSNQMVGINGLREIESQIRDRYRENLIFLNIEDPGFGQQYCFIKSLIRKGDETIKVEVLQNIPFLLPVESLNGLRLLSVIDIGVMKLQSVSSRMAQKDVYDLDRITDDIQLGELIKQLKLKEEKFNGEQYKCLFDLDNNQSPADHPSLLLGFDKIKYQKEDKRPSHSHDVLKLNENSKSWLLARAHWRRKVFQYGRSQGLPIETGLAKNKRYKR